MRLSAAVESRDALVLEHVGLVKSMAHRLASRLPRQVEVNELVGDGVLGLVNAADRYQPSLGVPFDAFARRRIMGAMLDSLRGLDWAPRSARRMQRHVDAARVQLRVSLGREPQETELADKLGVDVAKLRRTLRRLPAADGCQRRRSATLDPATVLDLLVDPNEGVVARLERAEVLGHLARAIESLPRRERKILTFYYEEELTMAGIGRLLGISESRVSQLRSGAISRLRVALRASLGLDGRASR